MHEAVVEEISVIRHMIGQENWQPRRIASVRTSGGPRMTVGLRDESGPGATIELFEEGTAPFGRAKRSKAELCAALRPSLSPSSRAPMFSIFVF